MSISKINKKKGNSSTRQATKIRNAFANKISADIKLSMVQISKII